ncbi:MAG: hypothetical protein U0270_19205 [Labilithrix sp.]
MSVCQRVFAFVAVGSLLVACSDVPNKTDALSMVQQDVKEEATCTLPINLLPLFKMQHTTKAVCVPREQDPAGKKTFDDVMACLNALVAANVTKPMPSEYMSEWPDEVTGVGLDSVPAYERRARNSLFKGCVAMGEGLRNGQFRCGQAKAEKVIRVSKTDDTHGQIRYARTLTLDATLASIDKACGAVTRPGPEATATIEKGADKKWFVVPEGTAASPSPSPSSHAK